jgi:hypothetical protein
MRRLCLGLVALAATVGFAQQTGRQTRLEAAAVTPAQAPVIELEFGRFTISVSESWTAQVFHMVDQLAQWDESSHKSYTRWARTNLTLDAEDRQLLQKHAEMRRGRGWGNGFEQAFLVDRSIEAAAAQAVDQKLLSADEAASEQTILLRFAPKLVALRDQHQQQIEAFKARLLAERSRLSSWFDKLVRFTETKTAVKAPVFLVANSEESSGGGEANGGRIVVEVPSPNSMGYLFHESLHVLLAPHLDEIGAAAESAGMRAGNLNEGIVYAMAPGLTDNPAEVDSLAEQVARFLQRGTPASDNYAQSYMIASVIRPVLRASIDAGETFPQFLPKAVAKWRSFMPRQ